MSLGAGRKVAPIFEGENCTLRDRSTDNHREGAVGAIAHQSPEAVSVCVGTRIELAAEAESVVVPDLRGLVVMKRSANSWESLRQRLTRVAATGRYTRVASQSPEPGTCVALIPPSPCAQNSNPRQRLHNRAGCIGADGPQG
jgi:hypothetical protein